MDDQIEVRRINCPRLEPEPVRSVQRVTAVRSGRKKRCVKKGSEMVFLVLGKGGIPILPLIPVAEWSQETVRQEKQ